MILAIAGAIAAAYQIFAIIACVRFRKLSNRALTAAEQKRPISILKAVRGLDPGFRAAIESHLESCAANWNCCAEYGRWTIRLWRVLREFPQVRVIECRTSAPNQKVGVLMDLARAAKHPILVVNDADIRVEPDYLDRVTAPLSDPAMGLVTCSSTGRRAPTFASRFEGLGVSTDFALLGIGGEAGGRGGIRNGGSTLAFRRADLERIGGFESIADYLADDYQLGAKLHGLGLKCVLSDAIVATHLGGRWSDVWTHQVRWARTIRVSKFAGYLGLPATFASVWAVALACSGEWRIALAVLAARMSMALEAGWVAMRSRDALLLWFLIPARDLFAAAVWVAGLSGNSVMWRGQKLRLDRQGRIQE